MILISHLNFTTKRERIPYILAFFESCLLEYLKSQVDVDKSTETQELTGLKLNFGCNIIPFIISSYLIDCLLSLNM